MRGKAKILYASVSKRYKAENEQERGEGGEIGREAAYPAGYGGAKGKAQREPARESGAQRADGEALPGYGGDAHRAGCRFEALGEHRPRDDGDAQQKGKFGGTLARKPAEYARGEGRAAARQPRNDRERLRGADRKGVFCVQRPQKPASAHPVRRGEQQKRGGEKCRPEPFSAEKDGIHRVSEKDAGERGGHRGEQHEESAPAVGAKDLNNARRKDKQGGEQRTRVQHDAEEEIRALRIRAEDALEEQQVPAGRHGQKFAYPLHGAENRRLPYLHIPSRRRRRRWSALNFAVPECLFRARIERELPFEVEIFRGIEGGELGHGDLVCRHRLYLVFAELFLIFPALNTAGERDLVSDLQISDEPRVAPPGDARNVIGLVIGAVDGDEKVGDLAVERRGAVYGRLADIAAQNDAVGVFCGGRIGDFAHENREHEARPALFQLVIGAELPQRAQLAAHGEPVLPDQPFGDGDGQYVCLPGKAHDLYFQLVKALAVHFVRELRFAHDLALDKNFVVFLNAVHCFILH